MSVFATLQKVQKRMGIWPQSDLYSPGSSRDSLVFKMPGTYRRYPRMWQNYEAIKETANPQTQAAATRTSGEVQDHAKGSRPHRRKMSEIKPQE